MPDAAALRALLPELEELGALRAGAEAAWLAAWEQSGLGERLADVPFAAAAPDEPLIAHIRAVTACARALAAARPDPPADAELLLAACLLHDVDKPLMLEPDGAGGWRKTAAARRIGHGFLGAMLCREHGLPEPVVHLVITHAAHAPLPPEPFEGVVLHYADYFAADAALFAAGAPLLSRH
jgi:putative nucleotidyltransferase with HDIG domain